jgi:hypothetical protein
VHRDNSCSARQVNVTCYTWYTAREAARSSGEQSPNVLLKVRRYLGDCSPLFHAYAAACRSWLLNPVSRTTAAVRHCNWLQ